MFTLNKYWKNPISKYYRLWNGFSFNEFKCFRCFRKFFSSSGQLGYFSDQLVKGVGCIFPSSWGLCQSYMLSGSRWLMNVFFMLPRLALKMEYFPVVSPIPWLPWVKKAFRHFSSISYCFPSTAWINWIASARWLSIPAFIPPRCSTSLSTFALSLIIPRKAGYCNHLRVSVCLFVCLFVC